MSLLECPFCKELALRHFNTIYLMKGDLEEYECDECHNYLVFDAPKKPSLMRHARSWKDSLRWWQRILL